VRVFALANRREIERVTYTMPVFKIRVTEVTDILSRAFLLDKPRSSTPLSLVII
jgi:hypothetical protein